MNERKYAENILDTGNLGQNEWQSISILARYFYHVEGLKRKKIIERLDYVLRQIMGNYDPVVMESYLDKVATKARSKPLVEIDSIGITEGEILRIQKLASKHQQRVVFTMCVLAKFFDMRRETNNHWINTDPGDVFKMAGVNLTIAEQAAMYRFLIDDGVIEYAKKIGNNNCRVLILEDGPIAVEISDLREPGKEYRLFCGEKLVRCERCGLLYKRDKNSGPTKHCKSCRETSVMSMRKFNCIDCGREVFVVGRNNRTCRCMECQNKANLLRHQRYNKKRNMNTTTFQNENP